jgi:hypothetical protein
LYWRSELSQLETTLLDSEHERRAEQRAAKVRLLLVPSRMVHWTL